VKKLLCLELVHIPTLKTKPLNTTVDVEKSLKKLSYI